MNTEFDEIRCYNNDEIPDALERLSQEKQFMKVLSTIYPLLPKDVIKQRLTGFKTNYDYNKIRGLIIEDGTLSQTTSSIWNMIIIGTICGILSYIALYFKRKSVLKEI